MPRWQSMFIKIQDRFTDDLTRINLFAQHNRNTQIW